MAIERLNLGRKNVVVGIRLDSHAQELLDWALVKVADAGDSVVAVHVCRNSGTVAMDADKLLIILLNYHIVKEKALLDGFLEDYEGLCNQKQVALSADVLKGNSIRKVLVREAKHHSASTVIVGIDKHRAFGRWASVAKYCAKKLPQTTEVMAIYNGKVVYSRCFNILFGDPKPSFYMNDGLTFRDNHSEFGESEVSETSSFSFDVRDDVVISPVRQKKGSLSSVSLPAEDFTKQRPGWPLLQTASSITQPALEAREMSIVQWVMNLPHRSFSENGKFVEMSTIEEHQEKLPEDLELILMRNSVSCRVFSHDVLRISTSEFSSVNLIGKGGCNSVYKGVLPEGKPVAVKILASSKEAWSDFIHEVDIMTTLKHERIAPLLGICVKADDLISVYDFMSRGNLEENLHGNRKENDVLSWESRFKIAVGIAEALAYLHNESPRPVIHRDIKSSNILLTDELEPQLCDFGLAIWGPTTASFLTDTDVLGTFGYLAPEYFMYGKVSNKIDVYAFGVVLLELLSGRKPIGLETKTTKDQQSLVIWAKPRLRSMDFNSLLDPKFDGNFDEPQMQRMAIAAALCLTQSARRRPKMCQILNILRGEESVYRLQPDCRRRPKMFQILNIRGEECVYRLQPDCDGFEDQENEEDFNDDEVYPDSSAESHLSLALHDINDISTSSFSSNDQSSTPLSVEEYLKKRWSRSSSWD